MDWTACWAREATMTNEDAFWSEVERLTEAGELRRLSGVFARFVATLGADSPAVLLAALVLSELEGRGHSCLLLSDLAADPAALLGWAEDDWKALAKAANPLPKTVKGWRERHAAAWVRLGDWAASPRHVLAAALVVGSVLFYIFASERLGFLPTVAISLLALMLTMRVPPGRAVLVALIASLVIHAAFYKLLRVPLPWGVLAPIAW